MVDGEPTSPTLEAVVPDFSLPVVVNYTPQEFVAEITFLKVEKKYFFDYNRFPTLQVGDRVIVQTNQLGQQMGRVKRFIRRSSLGQNDRVLYNMRLATPAELLVLQQWQERELPALIDCRERAAQIGGYGDVKFVAAEYNYNGSLLTIFYTSENLDRVNTARLRSVLQRNYDASVEFRQIGPRDFAKLQGGLGACGIPRCCSTFLSDYSTVSVNMAKAQGISLAPAELTGMCGRLRCCLIYEYEQYVEARKQLPRMRKRVGTSHGEGRVIDIHPLDDAVTVLVDEERHYVKREDLIPLSEMEALRKAAASPCSKNETGGCDCGAKRPRGQADDLLAEMGIEARTVQYEEDEDDLIDEDDFASVLTDALRSAKDVAYGDEYEDEILDLSPKANQRPYQPRQQSQPRHKKPTPKPANTSQPPAPRTGESPASPQSKSGGGQRRRKHRRGGGGGGQKPNQGGQGQD